MDDSKRLPGMRLSAHREKSLSRQEALHAHGLAGHWTLVAHGFTFFCGAGTRFAAPTFFFFGPSLPFATKSPPGHHAMGCDALLAVASHSYGFLEVPLEVAEIPQKTLRPNAVATCTPRR